MKLRTRMAFWFVSGSLLVTVVSAGLELVAAQPKSEPSRPALDTNEATFESLDEHLIVNINNIAYTSEDDEVFDIYFACSSVRTAAPLRLTDAKNIRNAKSYFNNEKRYGRHFVRLNKHCINMRNIAYIEPKDGTIVINFNSRISNSFLQLTLSGVDAETFKKKMGEF